MKAHITESDFAALPQSVRDRCKIGEPVTLPIQRAKGKPSHRWGEMNSTERAYSDHLELRKAAGEVLWFGFECITFRLADDCRYTPDFLILPSSLELRAVEVKATDKRGKVLARDDSIVKAKVAAATIPMRFVLVALTKQGKWIERMM